MQPNFHYYCVKALAQRSGLTRECAQTVAYASQYTDDATHHEPMQIHGLPPLADPLRRPDGRFDLICTAHQSLWELAVVTSLPATQQKVFVPFHFLPDAPGQNGAPPAYPVRPRSGWARSFLGSVRQAYAQAPNADARDAALIAFGILIHTYADTWSHQRFAGVRDPACNEITLVENLGADGHFHTDPIALTKFSALGLLIPPVGHGQARHSPDIPDRTWRYTLFSGQTVDRNNHSEFLDAAQACYDEFCALTQAGAPWATFANQISLCLRRSSSGTPADLAIWSQQFPDVTFIYDPAEWENSAIRPTQAVLPSNQAGGFTYVGTDDRWFHFHVAAKRQRHAVMNNSLAL